MGTPENTNETTKKNAHNPREWKMAKPLMNK